MEKCAKSYPNMVEKMRTRNQIMSDSDVNKASTSPISKPILSDKSVTKGLKKAHHDKSPCPVSLCKKKTDILNSKSAALAKRDNQELSHLEPATKKKSPMNSKIVKIYMTRSKKICHITRPSKNNQLPQCDANINLKKNIRSSKNMKHSKSSNLEAKGSKEEGSLSHTKAGTNLKRSMRSSEIVEIPKTPRKKRKNLSELEQTSIYCSNPCEKRMTRSSINVEISKPCRKLQEHAHLSQPEHISEEMGNKRKFAISGEFPSKEMKKLRKSITQSLMPSLLTPGLIQNKLAVSKTNSDNTSFVQKKITNYFSSPKSVPNNKTSNTDLVAKSGAEQNLSLDTSVEYDDKKVDIVYKVNKLFINDLKYPQISPFGLINFSCSSATGCSKKNHLNRIEQLSNAEEEILMFYVYEKCWYLLLHPLKCSITENVHLSPSLLRSIMYGIVTEVDNSVCTNLVKIFKTHLKLHPPCRKELKKLYKTVLFDPINIGKLNDPIVHYNFQNIIDKIEKTFEEISNKTKDVPAPQENVHKEEKENLKLALFSNSDNKLSLLPEDFIISSGDKLEKENKQADRIIDSSILLQRLFLIFSLSLDILEENFRIWWMKSRYRLKEASSANNVCPFIVSACWKKSQKKGTLNEHCYQVFALFKKCPHEYKHQLSRYITLLFYVVQINENNEERKFPFFHDLCNAFAAELTAHIKGESEPNESTLFMIQYINPPWLRFRICGILLKSEITSCGRNDLRSAYRIILRNLTASCKVVVKNLRNKSKQDPQEPNSKYSTGEAVLHKYCRQGKVDLLSNILHKNKVNVNIQDAEGWTPLHNAAFYGSVDSVNQLIKYRLPPIPGAEELNINALNYDNNTPLILAVQEKNDEIIDILLQNGAGSSVWNKNLKGSSAYDLAAPDLKEKLVDFWNKSIASFDHLQMTPIEIDLICTMISAYCTCFHIKEKVDENNDFLSKPDEYYKYDYACYFKDCITFERLTLVTRRLNSVPSNPNLKSLLHFLTSYC